MSVTRDKIINDAKILSLPDIYLRLKEVLADPDFTMADVVEVINQDPGISARLLKMVNSPYFGFASKIDTISRAVSMLGTQQVHDLVFATAVTQVFKGISGDVMDMNTFWRNSVYCAVMARLLASHCNLLDDERLFVTGLLADIGHLPMFQSAPELSQEALSRARQESKPLYLFERELFGFDSAEVGGILMQKWSLPQSLWEVVRFHTEPANSEEFRLETSIVHIASLVAGECDSETSPEQWSAHVDPVAWNDTGLSVEDVMALKPSADQELDAAVSLIFGGALAVA